MQLAENVVVAERFRLIRLLGRGGMGSVWLATHLGLDTQCALKFIEGEYANLPEAQSRFEREARAAAQLRSPHVVTIMDHGLWEGTPYIAMELLDGEDLGKRLASLPGGRLPMNELNTVITQVCRALTKAHTVGIVHRDLKPDNIFLVRDDDREIAKVLDFGIAKKNSTGLDTGNNTKTGAMLGTPYYMSPEQAQGIKGVDSRSDLWSLAVIVFQAITGRLPFESEALGDLLVKIIVAPVPVPSQYGVPRSIAAGFDAWFRKAADRDPAGRFQTAKEFGESLSLVLGQSQMTEMMDRNQLNAALAVGQTQLLNNTNAAPVSGPSALAQSAVAGTPMMNTPQHLMNTPNPGQYSGGGAPLQNTLGGMPAGLPAKKGGGAVIAGVAALFVVALGVGGFMVVRGRSASGGHGTATAEPSAMASVAVATATATTMPTVAATTAPTVPATATPTPTVTPEPTATAATTSTAIAAHDVGAGSKPRTVPTTRLTTTPPTTTPTTKPTGKTPKAPADMGF